MVLGPREVQEDAPAPENKHPPPRLPTTTTPLLILFPVSAFLPTTTTTHELFSERCFRWWAICFLTG